MVMRLLVVGLFTMSCLLAATGTDARVPLDLGGGARLSIERVETIAGTLLSPASAAPMPGKREFRSLDGRLHLTLEAKRITPEQYELRYQGSYFIRVFVSLSAPSSITGRWAPFACRLRPGRNPDVVITALGPATTPLTNALFCPRSDVAIELTGSATVGGGRHADTDALVATMDPSRTRLVVDVHRDWMRRTQGVEHYAAMDWSHFQEPQTGWCSWYRYYLDISEEEMLRNARWAAEHLKPYGLKWIQLDDGFQDYPNGGGRDWATLDPKKWPRSMSEMCREIRALGLLPGLWLIPHTHSSEAFVAQHPDWFVRNERGEYVDPGWAGKYLVDVSQPAVLNYFADLFRGFNDAGFLYYKIDGQPVVADLYREHAARLARPGSHPDEPYRMSLEVIRKAIGKERFLLGCYGTPLQGIGYMDGCRTGADVAPAWQGFSPALDATMRWYFLHGTAWWCDPDCLLVDEPLTLHQARLWATLYAITGQHLMLSERLYALTRERVEVVKAVLPAHRVRPLDLFPYSNRPHIWDLKVAHNGSQYDVVAAFNWEAEPSKVVVDFADLGLEAEAYLAYSFWEDRPLGPVRHGIVFDLPPGSCRVLVLRPLRQQPDVVGIGRHVVGDISALSGVRWDAATNTLSGTVQVAKEGDPISIVLWTDGRPVLAKEVAGRPAEDLPATLGMARLIVRGKTGERIPWLVRFGPREAPPPLQPIERLSATPDAFAVTLAWAEGTGKAYLVRNGVLLGIVEGREFVDRDVEPDRPYEYRLFVPDPLDGRLTVLASAVTTRTRRPSDAWADTLPFRALHQGWGTPQRGRSVTGKQISIAGQTFARGIGTHAESELRFRLYRLYSKFTAQVGVDDAAEGKGTVQFLVIADGKTLFDSGVMRGGEAAKPVDLDVYGVDDLRLIVRNGGDGIGFDHANWADAKLWAQ
ncbi:MAG: NPCBM/NEW2 domain-containing protein [Fimbriimonadia bacterium]|jgi:hypothetical protein